MSQKAEEFSPAIGQATAVWSTEWNSTGVKLISEISIMSPVLKTPFNILYAHQAPKKVPRHKKEFLVIFPALSCYVKLMSDPQATATCVHIFLVFGKEAAWVTLSPGSYQDDRLGDVPPQAGNMAGVKSSPLKREVIRSGVGRIGKDYHLVQFY